jgi:nitric oxide reductase activation protein
VEPNLTSEMARYESYLKQKYAGEIESMKRTFRLLRSKHYGNRMDFSGDDLDFEAYNQVDLECRVTGIKGQEKYFHAPTQNAKKPAWAVLADISPSTDPSDKNIIEQVKGGLLIQGESLGVTDYPFGLYAFSADLFVIKDYTQKYNTVIANKIVSVQRRDGGTNLGASLRVVGSLLARQSESPKGITIITDGESDNNIYARNAINELYSKKIYPFLIVIGSEFQKYAMELTSDIGPEHYSVIERDKVHELPWEMIRLFKTYGIAR